MRQKSKIEQRSIIDNQSVREKKKAGAYPPPATK